MITADVAIMIFHNKPEEIRLKIMWNHKRNILKEKTDKKMAAKDVKIQFLRLLLYLCASSQVNSKLISKSHGTLLLSMRPKEV